LAIAGIGGFLWWIGQDEIADGATNVKTFNVERVVMVLIPETLTIGRETVGKTLIETLEKRLW
jgi:hypothetical protein